MAVPDRSVAVSAVLLLRNPSLFPAGGRPRIHAIVMTIPPDWGPRITASELCVPGPRHLEPEYLAQRHGATIVRKNHRTITISRSVKHDGSRYLSMNSVSTNGRWVQALRLRLSRDSVMSPASLHYQISLRAYRLNVGYNGPT
ncbi:predicted protein [Histoplasma capsulatum G186AR]|uniref:Uncharacterized protein n=1 Tax=Ajellomyces capsulatus (strain G186AR / H82 / ATCC MYA-2454 / RMSCC 2432) TaxID=447093 RepID=C0NGF6_AJECG|nr:uncharacterized protein HCBG_02428 [Histoplasma capsulatum G186AR]EEH08891.1 predicted protein [Histoplasma capsulatum G186AR]